MRNESFTCSPESVGCVFAPVATTNDPESVGCVVAPVATTNDAKSMLVVCFKQSMYKSGLIFFGKWAWHIEIQEPLEIA